MRSPLSKTVRGAKFSALLAGTLATFTVTGLAQRVGTLSGVSRQFTPAVLKQIQQGLDAKGTFTAAENKLSSNLVFASRQALSLPVDNASLIDRTNIDSANNAHVKINVASLADASVLTFLAANGATVLSTDAAHGEVMAQVPLTSLPAIAADPRVRTIDEPDQFTTNVGAVTTQGYVTHQANTVVESLGINGTGVKVGVLSDSASATRVAALQATGDLPANTTVITAGTGEDEGCAMMEIIHDMAPGAQLYFNTGSSAAAFATAITTLQTQGCKVIVDDISFYNEGVFQDDTIAQAVNSFVASGGIYFSSAANSGNLDSGTGGCYEGDFLNGGAATGAVATSEGATSVAYVHNFGTAANPVLYDTLTATATTVTLKWSDPLTGGTDDYDLFVLSPDGTTVTKRSVSRQTGTRAPYESVTATVTDPATGVADFPVGSRVVIVEYAGTTTVPVATQTRALHLDTNRGALSLATRGSVYGHNGGANTQSMAATFWNSGRRGTVPFTGAANPVELFSSDGPRKIFYNPNGSQIGSGAPVFANSAAGTTLLKPDFTAADGVTCKTPGFSPFFGTSAAAPHAASIAALMLSANPNLTNTQIHNLLLSTALDNMAAGFDPDGGNGVLNALAAVNAARQTQAAPITRPKAGVGAQ